MADDVGLPKSSLQKAIKDLLPGDMRIAGDASDLLVQCCNQFVHLVSTQANVVSEREKRSTISPEHVVRALEELEFGAAYVTAVKAVWDEWKVDNREHQHQKLVHKKSGLGQSGLTQQQLIELQQKLFEEARAATLSGPLPSLAMSADPAALAAAAPAPAAVAGVQEAAAPAQVVAEQQQEQQQAQPLDQAAAQPGQMQGLAAAGSEGVAEGQEDAAAAGHVEGEEDDDDLDDVGDVDSELA